MKQRMTMIEDEIRRNGFCRINGKVGSIGKSCDPSWVRWCAMPFNGITTWHKSIKLAIAALPEIAP